MEKLILLYDSLCDALATLDDIILYANSIIQPIDPKLTEIFRDALIKRFEYCYDTSWKYQKEHLRLMYGIEVNSPKSVFHECLKQKIVNEEEGKVLFDMIVDRNMTTHLYQEKQVIAISKKIPGYAEIMKNLAQRTAPVK